MMPGNFIGSLGMAVYVAIWDALSCKGGFSIGFCLWIRDGTWPVTLGCGKAVSLGGTSLLGRGFSIGGWELYQRSP